MKYAVVTVPAAPVRKKPNHRTEMSNQLLFGEAVKILKTGEKNWLNVESLYDGYQGWITNHLITITDKQTAQRPIKNITTDFLSMLKLKSCVMHIPAGSFLFNLQNTKGGIKNFEYEYTGVSIDADDVGDKLSILIKNSYTWLNAPYMWGGKTILGVDCSGFAQTMYKLVGVPILRDAWLQAGQGALVRTLEDALPGDLAFFEEKNKIVHVGILLGPDKIIHAAGKVRIDPIDKKGIINSDTGKRTHQLKLIRRVIS